MNRKWEEKLATYFQCCFYCDGQPGNMKIHNLSGERSLVWRNQFFVCTNTTDNINTDWRSQMQPVTLLHRCVIQHIHWTRKPLFYDRSSVRFNKNLWTSIVFCLFVCFICFRCASVVPVVKCVLFVRFNRTTHDVCFVFCENKLYPNVHVQIENL